MMFPLNRIKLFDPIGTWVSPNQLGVTSYGEFRPIEKDKTQYARKKNRRIEISIIRLKKKQK